MSDISVSRIRVAAMLCVGLAVGACSGPHEDPRITLCKKLTSAMKPGQDLEWKEGDYTFNRPAFASTNLRFDALDSDRKRSAGSAACYYEYEALDDTAVTLADPISAYATLPFAMSVDGRALSDAELLQRVNAEQKRQGERILATLDKGAKDLAEKVRASLR